MLGIARRGGFGRIDRYLMGRMLPRMATALGITLAALVIERLVRLFDLMAAQGAPLGPVLSMAASLLPHYLGLALPAAFCIGIIGCLRALADANEIDVIEGAGWSLRRIGAPFVLSAAGLALVSLVLFGVVQPYSRYVYAELRDQILHAGWNGRVQQGVFFEVGRGLILSAEAIDPTGRVLTRVFVLREDAEGQTAITAQRGLVVVDPDAGRLHVVLLDGEALLPDGARLSFARSDLGRSFAPGQNPFRPRGESQRELTFAELWAEMHPGPSQTAEPRFAIEFHDRLVRAVSLLGVALLAVPLSMARKRTQAWPRIALAVAVLALYDALIKTVSGFAAQGRIDPALGLWTLALGFNGLGLLLYLATPGQSAALRLPRIGAGGRPLAAARQP